MNRKTLIRRFSKSKSFVIGFTSVVIIALACFLATLYLYHDPNEATLQLRLAAPEWLANGWHGHILGTDALGRDVLSRLLMGGRVSLTVAFAVIGISLAVGAVLGMIAGYVGGIVDVVIMRVADILHSIPQLLLAACVVAVLGASFFNLVFVLTISGWVLSARVVRGTVMSIKSSEYINASKVMGMSTGRILATQVLPNVLTPLIINETQHLGGVILAEASLSFLGLGIPMPTPSWGNMISEGREYITIAPWTVLVPGIALMILVLAFNFLGDGVRDALDPKNTN